MKRIVLVVASIALAVWAATAEADRVTQGPVIQATDVVAGERAIRIVHTVRQTNTLLPPILDRLEFRFPPGTRAHLPSARCDLAELQARGVKACPAAARIGSGSIIGRTTVYPSGVGSTATIVHGERIRSRRTVLLFVRPNLGPSFVSLGFVRGDRKSGVRLVLDFPPPIRTLVGSYEQASLSDFSLRIAGRTFPAASCPGVYRATSHFRFAGTLTSSDRARCDT